MASSRQKRVGKAALSLPTLNLPALHRDLLATLSAHLAWLFLSPLSLLQPSALLLPAPSWPSPLPHHLTPSPAPVSSEAHWLLRFISWFLPFGPGLSGLAESSAQLTFQRTYAEADWLGLAWFGPGLWNSSPITSPRHHCPQAQTFPAVWGAEAHPPTTPRALQPDFTSKGWCLGCAGQPSAVPRSMSHDSPGAAWGPEL